MKKTGFIVLFAFVLSAAFAHSNPAPGFDDVVDFSISLKELDEITRNRNFEKLEDVYLIINGSVSSYIVVDSEPETYTVELELIDGEWAGMSDVFLYRCLVEFSGPEYAKKFPERRRASPGPGEVPLNTGIIVVARFLEPVMEGDSLLPLLQGYYLRTFK